MSAYDEMIQKDLQLLWLVQDFCKSNPVIDQNMARIISKHPWQDISLVVWVLSGVGIYEIGADHFWVVAFNLAGSFALRKLIAARRPVEFDGRLRALTDSHAESFGFPTLESYMSVVILGHMMWNFESVWFSICAVLLILLVGFSRLYSRARFPHQVIGSWFLALVGLQLAMFCVSNYMNLDSTENHVQVMWVYMMLLAFVGNLALNIENNDSRLAGIPKKEFLRVLTGIIDSSNNSASAPPKDSGDVVTDGQGQPATNVPIVTPRSAAIKRAVENLNRKHKAFKSEKRDSFYYLQKTMESRAGISSAFQDHESTLSDMEVPSSVRRRKDL